MGKIKSAIITVIVTLATLVLFLFGVVSCNLPDGVHRYNSILSNIHLGSELSGDAYTTLLPEGVITAEEYAFTVVEDSDKAAEYEEKYVVSESGAYYVDREVLDSYNAGSDSAAFAALAEDLQSDAEILSTMAFCFDTIFQGDSSQYRFHLSHRGLFNEFLDSMGIRDRSVEILRTVDKLRKIGRDEVTRLLEEETGSMDKAQGILSFIQVVDGEDYLSTIARLEGLIGHETESSRRMRDIHALLVREGID